MQVSRLFLALTITLVSSTIAAKSAISQAMPTAKAANPVVEKLVQEMSLEEKIDYISGDDTGFATRAIPRLGIPAFRMTDGPLGTRNGGPAIAYGAGINLAATWNVDLAHKVGSELGLDAKARGVQIVLGPGVDIYRSPLDGYNFQHFGEDPYLVSRIAVGYIRGMQDQGVSADIKHWIGNNSEYDRHSTDSVIDERTLREIYFPPYEAAIKEAHVGTVMNGYNLTNGKPMSESYHLNEEVLRREWGFDGFLMPDWTGTRETEAVFNGGLDLEMPTAKVYTRAAVMKALKDGTISIAGLDEKVRRILTTAYRFGWFDHHDPDYTIAKDRQAAREVSLETAREGVVLLKNEGNFLPLKKADVHSIAVIGPNAFPAQSTGGGAAHVHAFTEVSLLEGLNNLLAGSPEVLYDQGIWTFNKVANFTDFTKDAAGQHPGLTFEQFTTADLSGTPTSSETVLHVNVGGEGGVATDPEQNPHDRMWATLTMSTPHAMRWSGYYTAESEGDFATFVETGERFVLMIDDRIVLDNRAITHAFLNDAVLPLTKGPHKVVLSVFPGGADNYRGLRLKFGIKDRKSLVTEAAKAMAAKADVVVLAVGLNSAIEGEGHDREYPLPFGQEDLISTMAELNKRVIVVVTSSGSVATERWLSRVPALLEAWYPGDQGGTALAEILFGQVNPSGRLPITWERELKDDPSYPFYYPEPGTNRAVYKEGVFTGYRGYTRNHIKPLFAFGYGKSYTSFNFTNATLRKKESAIDEPVTLDFDVTNKGSMAGAVVAQVYIHPVGSRVERPERELKGFAKVVLAPGETKHQTVILDQRAFSFYDTSEHKWRTDPGKYAVILANSAEDTQVMLDVVLH